jgi:hypothetical protein
MSIIYIYLINQCPCISVNEISKQIVYNEYVHVTMNMLLFEFVIHSAFFDVFNLLRFVNVMKIFHRGRNTC